MKVEGIEFLDPSPAPKGPTLTMTRDKRTDYKDPEKFVAHWVLCKEPMVYSGEWSKYVWFDDSQGHHHALYRGYLTASIRERLGNIVTT